MFLPFSSRDFRSSWHFQMDDATRRAYQTQAWQKLSALERVLKREKRLQAHIKNARLECFSLATTMHFAPPLYGVHYRSTRHRDLFDVSFYDCHNSFNPSRLSALHFTPFFYSCQLPLRRQCIRSMVESFLRKVQTRDIVSIKLYVYYFTIILFYDTISLHFTILIIFLILSVFYNNINLQ